MVPNSTNKFSIFSFDFDSTKLLLLRMWKAFLVIAVDEDCDILRFNWVDDVSKEEPNLYLYRITRVVFGVSSSPFLLNATVKYHFERQSTLKHLFSLYLCQ